VYKRLAMAKIEFNDGDFIIRIGQDVNYYDVGALDIRRISALLQSFKTGQSETLKHITDDEIVISISTDPAKKRFLFVKGSSDADIETRIYLPFITVEPLLRSMIVSKNSVSSLVHRIDKDSSVVLTIQFISERETSMSIAINDYGKFKGLITNIMEGRLPSYQEVFTKNSSSLMLSYQDKQKKLLWYKTTQEGDLEITEKIFISSDIIHELFQTFNKASK
jgi:hypothetical protein